MADASDNGRVVQSAARVPGWHTRSRVGWTLMCLAALLLGAGSVAGVLAPPGGPEPTLADVPTGFAWAVGTVGVLALIRGQMRGRSVDSAIEALLVTAPIAYLALVLVLDGRLQSNTTGQGVLVIGAVAADVVMVVLATELVRSQKHRRPMSAGLVLAGSACLLAAHAARAGMVFAAVAPSPRTSLVLAAAGATAAITWVVAALHPDARREPEPAATLPTALTRTRVSIVLLSSMVGPLVLAVRIGPARTDHVAVLTAGAVLVGSVGIAYLVRLVEQRARIEYLALHDDLCGIPNRVLLSDRIDSALVHALRHGNHVGLLFLDLDRFKNINDSLGHAAGNELLRAAAARLRDSVRAGDTVARLGGDEFAVLLPAVTDGTACALVAEKVLNAFEAPFEVAGRQLFVTPSIGVSLHPDDADDSEQLFRNADAAMYRAKENGRNTFELYTAEMNVLAHQRLTLESSLHNAVERGELVMHYQPKVELRTGRIVGMEALMRWEHPELGLLLPNEFIPLAEETGLIVPLGEWALEQSCAQTKAWADAGHRHLTVAVNLSARQFQQQQVGDMVARVLRSTGLDPTALELELTENLALQDPEAITAVLQDLRQMGVQCSIDDFGTGYSGLLYLTRFPIAKLKIDKCFINEISHGGTNARIVAAVIALAHGLRLEVIAEGVENDEQHRFLHEHGCDVMQGFLFSRAVPAPAFEQLLFSEASLPVQPAPLLRLIDPTVAARSEVAHRAAPVGSGAPAPMQLIVPRSAAPDGRGTR